MLINHLSVQGSGQDGGEEENYLKSEVPVRLGSKIIYIAKVIKTKSDPILRKPLNYNKIFGEIFDT